MSQKNAKRLRQLEGRVSAWEGSMDRWENAMASWEAAMDEVRQEDSLTQQRNDERRRAREAERAAAIYRTLTHLGMVVAILALAVAIVLAVKAEGIEAAAPASETSEPVEIIPPVAASATAATQTAREPEQVTVLRPANYIEDCTITFYCVCKDCCGKDPDHPDYGITASGRPAEPYFSVGVDPEVIPLGSIISMDIGDGRGEQRYRADDTGSGVKGNHIDVCVGDHQTAEELGRRTASVVWTAPEEVT